MSSSGTFESKIMLKTQLDTGGIISGLKQIQQQLQDEAKVKPSAFIEINNLLEKAEKKAEEIQRISKTGLTSAKDVERLRDLVSSFDSLIRNAGKETSKEVGKGYSSAIEALKQQAKEAADALKAELESIKLSFKKGVLEAGGSKALIEDLDKLRKKGTEYGEAVTTALKPANNALDEMEGRVKRLSDQLEKQKKELTELSSKTKEAEENYFKVGSDVQVSKQAIENAKNEKIKEIKDAEAEAIRTYNSLIETNASKKSTLLTERSTLKTTIQNADTWLTENKNPSFQVAGTTLSPFKATKGQIRLYNEGNLEKSVSEMIKEMMEKVSSYFSKGGGGWTTADKKEIATALIESILGSRNAAEAASTFFNTKIGGKGSSSFTYLTSKTPIIKALTPQVDRQELFANLFSNMPYAQALDTEEERLANIQYYTTEREKASEALRKNINAEEELEQQTKKLTEDRKKQAKQAEEDIKKVEGKAAEKTKEEDKKEKEAFEAYEKAKRKEEEQSEKVKNLSNTYEQATTNYESQKTKIGKLTEILQSDEMRQYYEQAIQKSKELEDQENKTSESIKNLTRSRDEANQKISTQNNLMKVSIEELYQELKATQSLTTVQQKVNKNFDQVINTIVQRFSALSVIRTALKVVKQTFSDIQKLDKAFGSIAMVTPKSLSSLWSQYGQYASMANRLGQQTQSAIEASALYYQQGLQMADVFSLTESTMKLATLAGQDFKEATKEMTAAIRAFNMEMSEGERITDVYSELAAHAAADVSGIATAMSKVASIAASSGAKFENISAFLTQIIETTQEAPSNAGTALKTVIARFSELKEAVDETDPEAIEAPYNKMDTALKSVGINLKDELGQIRAFDEVILELGAIWDTLSRNQQRYIATTAAGSRQQSRFLALMENNKRLLELIDVAEESSGKSQQQFDKYADTIEYRINKLKNSWERFRVSIFSSETYKKALGYINLVLERITDISGGDLLKITSAFALIGQTAAKGFLNGIKGSSSFILQGFAWIGNLGQRALTNVFGPSSTGIAKRALALNSKDQLFTSEGKVNPALYGSLSASKQNKIRESWNQAINGTVFSPTMEPSKLTEEQQAKLVNYFKEQDQIAAQRGQAYATTFSTAFLAALSSSSLRNQASNVFKDVINAGALTSVTQSLSIFSQTMTATGSAMKAFASGGLTLGITAAITVLTAAIATGIKAWQQYNEKVAEAEAMQYEFYAAGKSIEQLKENEKKLQEQLAETNNEYEQRKQEYNDILKKGKQLKELQDKIILTSEEKEESATLSNEIASFAPELIDSYDAEGNAIIKLTSTYEELVKAKRKAYAESRIQVAEENAQLTSNQYQQSLLEKQRFFALQNYLKQASIFENIKNFSAYQVSTQKQNQQNLSALWSMGPYPTAAALALTQSNTPGELLKSQNSKQLQDALKEIFKDSQVFNISEKKGEDIVKTIADILDESDSNIDLFNETIENFINSSKDFDKAMNETANNMKKASREIVEANLQTNSNYIDADSATQQAMVRYGAYKSNTIASTEKLVNAAEVYRAQAKSTGVKDIEAYVQERLKVYQENLNNTIRAIDYSFIAKTGWTSIQEELANLPLNEAANLLIKKLGESNEEVLAWIEDNKSGIEAANKKAELIAQAFGLKLKIELGGQVKAFEDDEELGKILSQAGTVIWDRIIGGLQDADKSGYRQQFINTFKAIVKDLSEDDLKEILNIPWENYTIFNANQNWEKVSEQGKAWRSALEKLLWNQDFSAEGIIGDITSEIESLQKEGPFAAIEKALTTQFKEGYIDTASLKALTKANIPLDKLYSSDSTINRETAEKYAKDLAQANINQAIALKEQYKQKTEILKTALLELKATTQVTSELYRQSLVRQGLGSKEVADEIERFEKSNKSLTKLEEQIDAREKAEPEFLKYVESFINDNKALYLNMMNEIEEAWQKQQEEAEKTTKKLEDAAKKVQEAYENIIEKQEALAEAQQKLNDTLYGSDTRKSSLDGLYNYQTALDILNEKLEEVKENLEDFEGSPKELLDELFETSRRKATYLGAENDRYNAAINSTYNSLLGQVNNYMKTIGNGKNYNISNFFKYNNELDRYEINQAAINEAQFNDDLKGFIETQIDLMNQYKKNISNNNKEIRKLEKELEDYRKKARDNYVSVEEEVVKKLEEYYKKQIEDKKEMYDALSEADNEYLDALQDAINKQRKLRDQQDKWNELTTKEKRLSLIQRDTSGANRKEIQKLQKEIQKDRQSMLDSAVDNIVDELKEFYELQKESREDELKYQEAIVDNTNLVAEANAIMQSWKSIDDMYAWMAEHTENIEDMSDAAVEKLTDNWKKMYNDIQIYNELQQKNVKETFDNTGNEIRDIVSKTTDSLVGEADRGFKEIKEQVDEAIKNAQDAVKNALKALTEAQEKYNEAIKEENELIEERKKQLEYKWTDDGSPKNNEEKQFPESPESSEIPPADFIGPQQSLTGIARAVMTNRVITSAEEIINDKGYQGLLSLYDLYPYQDIVYQVIKGVLEEKLPSSTFANQDVPYYDMLAAGNMVSGDIDEMLGLKHILKLPGARIGDRYYFSLNESEIDKLLQREAPSFKGDVEKFAKGGLVDFTGPAWVDGTKSRPEAFLSSEDTLRLGQAASILRDLVSYSRGNFSNATISPNVRESNTEIHIHVDSIATESQVDYLIDRLKEEIVDAANPIGSSVILH